MAGELIVKRDGTRAGSCSTTWRSTTPSASTCGGRCPMRVRALDADRRRARDRGRRRRRQGLHLRRRHLRVRVATRRRGRARRVQRRRGRRLSHARGDAHADAGRDPRHLLRRRRRPRARLRHAHRRRRRALLPPRGAAGPRLQLRGHQAARRRRRPRVRGRDHGHRAHVQRRPKRCRCASSIASRRRHRSTRWSPRPSAQVAANAPLTVRAAMKAIDEGLKPSPERDLAARAGDGGCLLRQRRLQGRPPGVHGEAQASVSRPLSRALRRCGGPVARSSLIQINGTPRFPVRLPHCLPAIARHTTRSNPP